MAANNNNSEKTEKSIYWRSEDCKCTKKNNKQKQTHSHTDWMMNRTQRATTAKNCLQKSMSPYTDTFLLSQMAIFFCVYIKLNIVRYCIVNFISQHDAQQMSNWEACDQVCSWLFGFVAVSFLFSAFAAVVVCCLSVKRHGCFSFIFHRCRRLLLSWLLSKPARHASRSESSATNVWQRL